MLTVKQAAEQLHVSPQTVYQWIERKMLSAIKYPSGTVRISEEEVDAFIAKSQAPADD